MKEPNKIDGNRRDLLKGLGIAAVVSLLPETGNAAPKAASSAGRRSGYLFRSRR